ncbi:MAG: substrate-binding domain-containing protein [SAR324 cluster bacterium]|nr:substrate-binding domain-containing protein [SAR324 cluster bacterium]
MLVKRITLLFIMLISAGFVFAKTIALVQINQQAQFFTDMNRGAEAEAAKLGHKLVIYNANNDPAAQNNAIETYIQQKVDGLIVVAIDTNGIMPAVIQAANAGIPVVAVDAILPDGPQIAQVGVNNYGAGVLIANAFLDYVSKEMGGEASIGIVGALNSTIQNVRQKGFTDTLSKNSNVNIVGVVDGRNVSEQAMAASENLFTANPSMNAVYATGEPALIGAVAATEAQGLEGDIKIFGWDLTSHSINGIDKGYVISVVQQSPYGMGQYAVGALNDNFNGKMSPRVVDVPITLVNKSNVGQFK